MLTFYSNKHAHVTVGVCGPEDNVEVFHSTIETLGIALRLSGLVTNRWPKSDDSYHDASKITEVVF